MSSPQMTRILGFLPLFPFLLFAARFSALASKTPLGLRPVQHSAGSWAGFESACLLLDACRPFGAASADQFHGPMPLAAPYPSSPPTARKIRPWIFGLLNMSPPSLKKAGTSTP